MTDPRSVSLAKPEDAVSRDEPAATGSTSIGAVGTRGQLRQFLEALGGFSPPKPPPEPGDEPVPPLRSSRWLLFACGFVAIISGWLYLPTLRRPLEAMPPNLLGAWETSTPDYADRGFWIGRSQVAFRVGPKPNDVNVYPVTRIRARETSGNATTYNIEYAVDGGTNQWSIRYSGSPNPTIVFIHQPEMTWTARQDSNPPIR